MGQHINLSTPGDTTVAAYLAKPATAPRGGVVVIQEIFGVTPHIRSVADRLADAGYTAIAPSFFDRVEPGVELGYDQAGINRGVALAAKLGVEGPVQDVTRAAQAIADAGKVATIGFCWGGTIALLSAQRLGLPSVSYYGGRNANYLDNPLKAPVMFHFGAKDTSITADTIDAHRKHYADMAVHVYPGAGHAFNRDVPGDPHYHAESAKLAWDRTLAFLHEQLSP